MKENKARYQSIIHQSLIALVMVYGLFDLVYTFTGVYAQFGLLYPAAHGLLNIIMFLALSFIWTKDKWGTWIFLGVIGSQMLLDLFTHRPLAYQFILLLPAIYFLISQRR